MCPCDYDDDDDDDDGDDDDDDVSGERRRTFTNEVEQRDDHWPDDIKAEPFLHSMERINHPLNGHPLAAMLARHTDQVCKCLYA